MSMNKKAAIFDVDGTIINGNLTKIFIQYLFDKSLIERSDLARFNRSWNYFLSDQTTFFEVIHESVRVLSIIDQADFGIQWKTCFDEVVRKKFRKDIVLRIKKYQENGTKLILASGSHFDLVSHVGTALDIDSGNIIATESELRPERKDTDQEDAICYGVHKHVRVINLLAMHNIVVDNTSFYTDNLSDLPLLRIMGNKYWVGSREAYQTNGMHDEGIELLENTDPAHFSTALVKRKMNKSLHEYYRGKELYLNESITKIIPEKCTPETMDILTGRIELQWDLETLQKSFFDPLYDYIKKKKKKTICLGSCLFMEAGNIDMGKYQCLVGIGELLETSFEMFKDIRNWTSGKELMLIDKSHIEISIIGNVCISLITLSLHHLLSGKIKIKKEKQLRLLESFTSVIFHSLLGNGFKLYREQKQEIITDYTEYYNTALLINRGLLQIPCDLWRILQDHEPDKATIQVLTKFVENISLAVSLQKDLEAFLNWKSCIQHTEIKTFSANSNFLRIHAAGYFNNPGLFLDNQSPERALSIISRADSEAFARNKIRHLKSEGFRALEELPIKRKFIRLIRSYVNYLLQQQKSDLNNKSLPT